MRCFNIKIFSLYSNMSRQLNGLNPVVRHQHMAKTCPTSAVSQETMSGRYTRCRQRRLLVKRQRGTHAAESGDRYSRDSEGHTDTGDC